MNRPGWWGEGEIKFYLDGDEQYPTICGFGMYRWHVLDPIHFATDVRVDIQALGWKSGHRYQPLTDDIASTAFFYLDRPEAARPLSPAADDLAVGGFPIDPLT